MRNVSTWQIFDRLMHLCSFYSVTRKRRPLRYPFDQWSSTCGTRTTSGTPRSARWYSSNFKVVPFFTKIQEWAIEEILDQGLPKALTPNCGEELFYFFIFWSSIEFGCKI